MSDELTQAPVYSGPFVTFQGRTFLRIAGGEIDQAGAEQDTSVEDAAPEGTPADQESGDPEYTPERVRGLHAELTKAQQENARLRAIEEGLRDPERAAEVLQQYGYSFGDEEDPGPAYGEEQDDTEPLTALEQRQAQLEAQWQQQHQQQVIRDFNAHVAELAGDMTLSEDDRTLIYLRSANSGGGTPTPEATKQAFEALKQQREDHDKQVIERYVSSKKSASRVSAAGTGATDEVLPLDATHAQRVAWQVARMNTE